MAVVDHTATKTQSAGCIVAGVLYSLWVETFQGWRAAWFVLPQPGLGTYRSSGCCLRLPAFQVAAAAMCSATMLFYFLL